MANVPNISTVALSSSAPGIPLLGDFDPFGISKFISGVFRAPDLIRQGIVVGYNPQTHTASVFISGEQTQSQWACVFADEMLSYSFGFSMTCPPREGEFVLVMRSAPEADSGIILGRIPYMLNFMGKGDLYSDPDSYHRRLFTQLEDTSDLKIPCFLMPFQEENDDSTHIATHFRPTDVYPGEFANVNQHNCGIKGGLFSATLLGGGANLRMSALTNTARLSCESYIRHTLHGTTTEFHNGRYLSSERSLSLYQEERLGGLKKEDTDVWTFDSEKPAAGENQTLRPRQKDLTGFFGHLVSKFCFRPDPEESSTRAQGKSKPNEEGVSRETIDPSGQYRLSAAGMIAIERTGRIPVPVRTCYPTDKDHDIQSDPEVLKPFEHDDEDPCYRQLELFDRQAYDLKNQYSRVDGLGFKSGKDYHVPQEEDLKPLKDKYDPKFFGNETVKLEKFDKRRAGVYIGEDGSVIIRDAWGSEIVMAGGNISFACAGNVMNLPGKTALTIAGDDIVQKAQNSVDIHASEHDVRLSAASNMEILGEGDANEHSGGVIISSRRKAPQPWDGKDKGESAQLSGITLKTKKQGVVIDGARVNIRSKEDTRIISGDKGVDGKISIGSKLLRTRSEKAFLSTGDSNIVMSSSGTQIVSKDIGIYAEGGLDLMKGSQIPIPLYWADAENAASKMNPQYAKATEDLKDEKSGSLGFDREALDKMMFGFRTSEECGTTTPWVIGDKKGNFKLYEPAWVQVMNVYETLKNGGVKSKAYEEKPNWENGIPFPGKKAKDDAKYARLSGLKPKNLTEDGFNKKRDAVKEKSDVEEVNLDGNYLIRE